MKKLYLTLLMLLLITFSFAQKIRFSDSTNTWEDLHVSIADNPPDLWYHHNHYGGDTIINSMHYRQLLGADAMNPVFIREDTILNKVFLFTHFSDTIIREEVLMDYNLQTGDTIKHTYTYDTMAHVVASVDSTMVGNTWYRVWNFEPVAFPSSGIPYSVIEGIGCTSGPIFPVWPRPLIEDYWYMYCFSNNNTAPPVNPPVGEGNFNNTSSCHLDVTNTIARPDKVYIVPNPVNEHSKIVFPYTIAEGSLYINNIMGQTVRTSSLQQKQEQTIGILPAKGLYFYILLDKTRGHIFSGKIIYE